MASAETCEIARRKPGTTKSGVECVGTLRCPTWLRSLRAPSMVALRCTWCGAAVRSSNVVWALDSTTIYYRGIAG
eukprot:3258212-Amphidinium_carterae.1